MFRADNHVIDAPRATAELDHSSTTIQEYIDDGVAECFREGSRQNRTFQPCNRGNVVNLANFVALWPSPGP